MRRAPAPSRARPNLRSPSWGATYPCPLGKPVSRLACQCCRYYRARQYDLERGDCTMALARPIQPIQASDEELEAALGVADLPALLPALAHITGDLSLLRPELRIDSLLIAEDQGGLTPEQQAAIR